MQRVVVTGLGIVSSLGCTSREVTDALLASRSGLKHCPELSQQGLPTSVYAPVNGFDETGIDSRAQRTMSTAAVYAAVAANAAIADAHLAESAVAVERAAVIVGGELGGINDLQTMRKLLHSRRKSRSGATGVTKVMDSGASGNVASLLGYRGRAYAVSTGLGSGLAAIRHGVQLITRGLADIVLCGAAEEDSWRYLGPALHRWGELPLECDDQPERACRPFDARRSGTVLSAGSGMIVLESLHHAQQRSAEPYAEVVGWGWGSDGGGSPRSTGTGLRRAVSAALRAAEAGGVHSVDYVHSGAAGTRQGDAIEALVLRELIGSTVPVSSTTGWTGLAVGAAAAIQVVLTLLMLRGGFLVPTANLEQVARECDGLLHIRSVIQRPVRTALCTAASFGCFNECLVLRRYESAGGNQA